MTKLINELTSFEGLSEFFMIKFSIKIIVLVIIINLHGRNLKLSSLSSDEIINAKLDSLASWIRYIAPIEPYFSFSNSIYCYNCIVFTCVMMYMRFLRRGSCCKSTPFYKFIKDTKAEKESIQKRLDNYIDELSISNKSHASRILKQDPKKREQIRLLYDELGHLDKLRHDKRSIWPSNRTDIWAGEGRNLGCKVATLLYLPIYSIIVICALRLLIVCQSYRISHNINYELSFIAKVMLLEIMMATFVVADWLSIEGSLFIVAIVDQKRLATETNESIRKFMLRCAALRQVDRSGWGKCSIYWDEKKHSIRAECSRLALEAYIKLRYQIDVMIDLEKIFSLIFGVVIIMVFSFGLLTFFTITYVDIRNEETIFAIIIVSILFGTINFILILFAYFYTYCHKNLKRTSSICAVSLAEPRDNVIDPNVSLYDRLIISSHVYFLWKKLAEGQREILTKLAVTFPGGYKLNYASTIKFDSLSLYLVTLYNYHFKVRS